MKDLRDIECSLNAGFFCKKEEAQINFGMNVKINFSQSFIIMIQIWNVFKMLKLEMIIEAEFNRNEINHTETQLWFQD